MGEQNRKADSHSKNVQTSLADHAENSETTHHDLPSLFAAGAALARSGDQHGNWHARRFYDPSLEGKISINLLDMPVEDMPRASMLSASLTYDTARSTATMPGRGTGTYEQIGAVLIRTIHADGSETFDALDYGYGKPPDRQTSRSVQMDIQNDPEGILAELIQRCQILDKPLVEDPTQEQLRHAGDMLVRLLSPLLGPGQTSQSANDRPTSKTG